MCEPVHKPHVFIDSCDRGRWFHTAGYCLYPLGVTIFFPRHKKNHLLTMCLTLGDNLMSARMHLATQSFTNFCIQGYPRGLANVAGRVRGGRDARLN